MTREEGNRLLHAHIDRGLDVVKTLELEAHLVQNRFMRMACERLRQMPAAIRDKGHYYVAPAWLEARVRAAIAAEAGAAPARPSRHAWLKPAGVAVADWLRPAASFAAVALVTWVVALGTMRPGEDERITQEVSADILQLLRAFFAGRAWMPRFASASRSRYSIWPLTERSSACARRSTSAQRSGSMRSRYALRSATIDQVYSVPVLTIGCVSRSEHSTTMRVDTIAARRSSSSSTTFFSERLFSAISTIDTAPITIVERAEITASACWRRSIAPAISGA